MSQSTIVVRFHILVNSRVTEEHPIWEIAVQSAYDLFS